MEAVNNPDEIMIYGDATRIIARDRILRKECLVDLAELNWNEDCTGEMGIELSLKSIERQLMRLGYKPVFYVWSETPLEGVIYEFGNYSDNQWYEHGHMKGYA